MPGVTYQLWPYNNSVWAVTWISIGNELNLIGQMNVIRVARAYITSRLESIQIPEQRIMNDKSLKLWHYNLLDVKNLWDNAQNILKKRLTNTKYWI